MYRKTKRKTFKARGRGPELPSFNMDIIQNMIAQ
jgi:hypothetical protein